MTESLRTNPPLRLSGSVVVEPTAEALCDKLAGAIIKAANTAVSERGAFHLALSGGSTPKPLYEKLGAMPNDLPWAQTHLWIVDERRVPEDDDRNNYRMIREAMVDPLGLSVGRVHPVPVSADDPAGVYERELRDTFETEGRIPRIDFVLLGIGDDGHTASLFPGMASLDIDGKLIANADVSPGTQPNVGRVTMTYPLLNKARHLAVLVTGAKKVNILRQIAKQLESGPDRHRFPITGIQPAFDDATLTWYLDAAAAGGNA